MNGDQKQAVCFGSLLLGFYAIYMGIGPAGDGAILSIFIGALAAFGGYQAGIRKSRTVNYGDLK